MKINIRVASLDDVEGIVQVHCSGIDKWVRHIESGVAEVDYDDLSVAERFRHGGPWMSVETCAIHLNNLLTNGQYPLIAELNGRIVGEAEIYVCSEKNFLGKYCYIDVLEVHKCFRRRGVGKSLINKAIELAREKGCEAVAVWPAKEAVGFYRKCGLDTALVNIIHLEIDLKNAEPYGSNLEVKPFPCSYDMVQNMILISPKDILLTLRLPKE